MLTRHYVLEKNIKTLYKGFFKKNGINFRNGKLKGHDLKFASYPYIGSKYGTGKKILFVGLDLGKDESENILGFAEKRKVVEGLNYNLKKMGPHIAGIYITTIFFLNIKMWRKIRLARSYKEAVKTFQKNNNTNLLSIVALTNLFKFVTPKRIHRHGGGDRKHIFKDNEEELLLNEIKIFEPKIIVFQSLAFHDRKYKSLLNQVLLHNPKTLVFIAPHPSYHGNRKPGPYIALLRRTAYGV